MIVPRKAFTSPAMLLEVVRDVTGERRGESCPLWIVIHRSRHLSAAPVEAEDDVTIVDTQLQMRTKLLRRLRSRVPHLLRNLPAKRRSSGREISFVHHRHRDRLREGLAARPLPGHSVRVARSLERADGRAMSEH